MKQLGQLILGFALLIVGAIVFLQNVVVNSFSIFYRINNVSVGGILLVLIMIAFIALIVKSSIVTKAILGTLILAFFVCMIISLNIRVATISGLQLVLILGIICIGLALIIKTLFVPAKE